VSLNGSQIDKMQSDYVYENLKDTIDRRVKYILKHEMLMKYLIQLREEYPKPKVKTCNM
jgi:hypothetical protein